MSCLLTAGIARTSRHFRRQWPQSYSSSTQAKLLHVYIAPNVEMFKEILGKTRLEPVIFIKADSSKRLKQRRNVLTHNDFLI